MAFPHLSTQILWYQLSKLTA